MAWRTVGTVFVLRERSETPSNEEWREFLSAFATYRASVKTLRILIVTDGGGPNRTQRIDIKDAIGGLPFRSAVVSDSTKIRFIASAIMLINRNHGSFTPDQVERAFEHLSLTPAERDQTQLTLRHLTEQLCARPSLRY